MGLCGYGRILDVNLSTGVVTTEDTSPQFAREFIGGMGFSCKMLYDQVGTDVEPYGPDNVVIFANGPLTGTQAPASGRTEVTTKSPLTGRIGTGNTGGMWGARLKHAGFDVIVIRGSSTKPVYLWVDDSAAQIREASGLWGRQTQEASDIIGKELGLSPKSEVSVLAIGPAGENLVRYACTVNDYHHVAGRCGAGAVMGAKKLKAIAVRGSGTVDIARPQEFREAAREARERLLAADRAMKMPGGAPGKMQDNLALGCLPGKNFQTGSLPHFLETLGPGAARPYVTGLEGTCYSCPISCFSLVEVRDGKYAGTRVSRGTAPGIVLQWGAKLAINNLPAIWKCKELCQHLGLDYASASGCIAFAMELCQRGIVTKKETDGLELSWGNEDAIMEMLRRIAFRQGFGDILAEGSVSAARVIRGGAERYAMTTKGVEMMSADPRSGSRGWIFGDLTNPKGGDNVKCTHFRADLYSRNWWVDKFDMPEHIKKTMYPLPTETVNTTWEGKALMCKWFEDLVSVLNALGLCFTPSINRIAVGPSYLARLLSACTGWDTTSEDVMKFGEKVFTLLKVHTVRQGLGRKDDTWPDRFFEEPLPEGPAQGAVLSRDKINRLLDEYYELRGWDKHTGLPTAEKLVELGLHDEAKELAKLGKIR